MYEKILHILHTRGVTQIALDDFTIADDSDGDGPYIAAWDSDTLGPQPTALEIAAVSDADAAAALLLHQATQSTADLDKLTLIALVARYEDRTTWDGLDQASRSALVTTAIDGFTDLRAYVLAALTGVTNGTIVSGSTLEAPIVNHAVSLALDAIASTETVPNQPVTHA